MIFQKTTDDSTKEGEAKKTNDPCSQSGNGLKCSSQNSPNINVDPLFTSFHTKKNDSVSSFRLDDCKSGVINSSVNSPPVLQNEPNIARSLNTENGLGLGARSNMGVSCAEGTLHQSMDVDSCLNISPPVLSSHFSDSCDNNVDTVSNGHVNRGGAPGDSVSKHSLVHTTRSNGSDANRDILETVVSKSIDCKKYHSVLNNQGSEEDVVISAGHMACAIEVSSVDTRTLTEVPCEKLRKKSKKHRKSKKERCTELGTDISTADQSIKTDKLDFVGNSSRCNVDIPFNTIECSPLGATQDNNKCLFDLLTKKPASAELGSKLVSGETEGSYYSDLTDLIKKSSQDSDYEKSSLALTVPPLPRTCGEDVIDSIVSVPVIPSSDSYKDQVLTKLTSSAIISKDSIVVSSIDGSKALHVQPSTDIVCSKSTESSMLLQSGSTVLEFKVLPSASIIDSKTSFASVGSNGSSCLPVEIAGSGMSAISVGLSNDNINGQRLPLELRSDGNSCRDFRNQTLDLVLQSRPTVTIAAVGRSLIDESVPLSGVTGHDSKKEAPINHVSEQTSFERADLDALRTFVAHPNIKFGATASGSTGETGRHVIEGEFLSDIDSTGFKQPTMESPELSIATKGNSIENLASLTGESSAVITRTDLLSSLTFPGCSNFDEESMIRPNVKKCESLSLNSGSKLFDVEDDKEDEGVEDDIDLSGVFQCARIDFVYDLAKRRQVHGFPTSNR